MKNNTTKDPRSHHDRIQSAKNELQKITDILSKLCGNGEDQMESCVEWFIPKLDAVSSILDAIELEMLCAEGEAA